MVSMKNTTRKLLATLLADLRHESQNDTSLYGTQVSYVFPYDSKDGKILREEGESWFLRIDRDDEDQEVFVRLA